MQWLDLMVIPIKFQAPPYAERTWQKEKAQPSEECPCSGWVGSTVEKLGGKVTKSRDFKRSLGGAPGRDAESILESPSGKSPAEGHPEG